MFHIYLSNSNDDSAPRHGEERAKVLSSSQMPHTFNLIQPVFIKQLLQAKDDPRHRQSWGLGELSLYHTRSLSVSPASSVGLEAVPGRGAEWDWRIQMTPHRSWSGARTGHGSHAHREASRGPNDGNASEEPKRSRTTPRSFTSSPSLPTSFSLCSHLSPDCA